jgi:hypothetical protein
MDLNGKTLGREELFHQQRIAAAAVALEPDFPQPILIAGPEPLGQLGSSPRL